MEQYDLWKLDKKLQKEVDEDRYHHTLGVMFTAASMAMVWGEDLEKARVAGLLHDCAKCIPNKKKITDVDWHETNQMHSFVFYLLEIERHTILYVLVQNHIHSMFLRVYNRPY